MERDAKSIDPDLQIDSGVVFIPVLGFRIEPDTNPVVEEGPLLSGADSFDLLL